MVSDVDTRVRAWQPLTPRGVAAFARAPLRWLLLVQCLFALLLALIFVWFFETAWFPTIHQAIQQLPPRGEIRSGKLDWSAASPQVLAEGHFLALTVDLNHSATIRSPAHLQVEFGRRNVRFISLFGYADRRYPDGEWIVLFNRADLEPWWGAWRLPLLALTAIAVIAGATALWAVLATIYMGPVWLVGFYANRELGLWKSWKLGGAALMPGILLLAAGIVLYGAGALDVVQLIAIAAGHLVVGWVYVSTAIFCAPKLTTPVSTRRNPFAPAPRPPDGPAIPPAP